MIKFIFFILLCFSQLSFAQETLIPLLIQDSYVEGSKRSFYQEQLRKITLDTIRRFKKYEIFLSTRPEGEDRPVNYLDVSISDKGEFGYLIEVKQISGKSSRILKESWASFVPERFVLLQSRINLVEVLYGKGMARKLQAVLMKQNPEFAQAQEGGDHPIVSSLNNKELPPYLKKSPTDNSMNEKASKDLADLRKEIERNLVKTTEEMGNKDTAHKDQKKEEPTGEVTLLSEGEIKKNDNPFGKGIRPRESSLAVDLVYLNRHLQSQYLLDITNNLNYAGPRITYRKNLSDTKGDDFVFSVMNLKALKVNKVDFNVPDLRNVHAQFLKTVSFLPFDLLIGAHYDNQIFINLAEYDTGLKMSENHLVWAQFGIERTFNWSLFSVSLQALYAQNFFSKSSFMSDKDIKLDASRYSLGAELLLKKIRLGVFMSKEEVTSRSLNNFSISQDSFFMNFAYVF